MKNSGKNKHNTSGFSSKPDSGKAEIREPAVIWETSLKNVLSEPENRYQLVQMARTGVSPEVFYDFAARASLPEHRLATLLNLSSRTLKNYSQQHKVLDPVQGEQLLKLISLYALGKELFGNTEEFESWMQKPLFYSADKPADLIITPGGIDLVMDDLRRLAFGDTL